TDVIRAGQRRGGARAGASSRVRGGGRDVRRPVSARRGERAELSWGEEILPKERGESRAGRDGGLLGHGLCLVPARGRAPPPQRGNLLVRKALQHEEADLTLGRGEAPARELPVDLGAEPSDVHTGFSPPLFSVGSRLLEVTNQLAPLLDLRAHPAGEHACRD